VNHISIDRDLDVPCINIWVRCQRRINLCCDVGIGGAFGLSSARWYRTGDREDSQNNYDNVTKRRKFPRRADTRPDLAT
jgi:hypothetical protein